MLKAYKKFTRPRSVHKPGGVHRIITQLTLSLTWIKSNQQAASGTVLMTDHCWLSPTPLPSSLPPFPGGGGPTCWELDLFVVAGRWGHGLAQGLVGAQGSAGGLGGGCWAGFGLGVGRRSGPHQTLCHLQGGPHLLSHVHQLSPQHKAEEETETVAETGHCYDSDASVCVCFEI